MSATVTLQMLRDIWLVHGPAPDDLVRIIMPARPDGEIIRQFIEATVPATRDVASLGGGIELRVSEAVPSDCVLVERRDGQFGIVNFRVGAPAGPPAGPP